MTKVLIVDDDEVYRSFLTMILSKAGFVIAGAVGTGDEAVTLARRQAIDIVLMDIQLGHSMDGIETAGKLRTITESPIIFISAYDSDTFIEKTRGIHAAGCLVKPIKLPDLEVSIRSALERQHHEKRWKTETELTAHAQKIETLGMLAGGIAHEFNSLLTVILGYAKYGQKQVPTESPALNTFQEIYQTARKATNLTRQILAFSSNQMIEFVNVDVSDLVRKSLRFAKSVLDDGLEIIEDIEKGPLNVRADASQLEQALINIYRNARESMPGGGLLEVSCRQVNSAANSSGTPDSVLITVRDSGRGIDPQDLKKVFDPFFTTKPRGEGSGLGLSVAHGVLRQHKGSIKIDSQKGIGTTVSIMLALEATEPVTDPVTSQGPRRGTILIAEDTELLKKMLHTILSDMGYDVLVASDGEEAIQVFRGHPNIQVVLLDMIMPKKTGREVYETLAPEARNAKFLLSSGYTSDRDILDFAHRNRIELIPKPYDPDELARKIQSLTDL